MTVEPEFELDGETEKISKLADKDGQIEAGDEAFITGWGKTDEKKASIELRGLGLKIMDFGECVEDYKHFGDMAKCNICAEHPSGIKDMCNDDSQTSWYGVNLVVLFQDALESTPMLPNTVTGSMYK